MKAMLCIKIVLVLGLMAIAPLAHTISSTSGLGSTSAPVALKTIAVPTTSLVADGGQESHGGGQESHGGGKTKG